MMRVVLTGDCREMLAPMGESTFDAVVTDPPYGLGFMGQGWDRGVPGPEFWAAALRAAKPGAHLVAFGGPRTSHRLVCAIEDAGWEIRDSLAWLFGQGFPKSLDVAGAAWREFGPWPSAEPHRYDDAEWVAAGFDGCGTALKPAHEPIVLARKPLEGTVAENVLKWGCGALAIDACRVPMSQADREFIIKTARPNTAGAKYSGAAVDYCPPTPTVNVHDGGRWPANVVLGCACEVEHDPGCAVAMLDARSGPLASGIGAVKRASARGSRANAIFVESRPVGAEMLSYGDAGGASRFFYVAKATRAERERWLREEAEGGRTNKHPTVKPVSLMRWLVRLVGGPRGRRILDPFCGSGTTGVACALEGYDFTGIDLDEDHCELARARIVGAHEEAGTLDAAAERSELNAAGPVQLGLMLGTGGA